jgi:hypothetical protein
MQEGGATPAFKWSFIGTLLRLLAREAVPVDGVHCVAPNDASPVAEKAKPRTNDPLVASSISRNGL